MSRDFAEMLSALSDAGADHLVVGAHALAAHGVVRATGDLDVWVRPSPENALRVWNALARFGAPLHDLRPEDLQSDDLVFQIGVAPHRIDILTSIDGVTFEEAWPDRIHVRMAALDVPVIGRVALLRNKRAVGRAQDRADVERLEGR